MRSTLIRSPADKPFTAWLPAEKFHLALASASRMRKESPLETEAPSLSTAEHAVKIHLPTLTDRNRTPEPGILRPGHA
jgi:hypothetical protein